MSNGEKKYPEKNTKGFFSKSLISWFLFDWANSAFPVTITTFIFATYFTQKVAVNPIVGIAQWGDAMSLAAVFIVLISPALGAIADNQGRRKPWLAFFVLLTASMSTLLWFVYPTPSYAFTALCLVVIGQVSMEIGVVFYNSMLSDLVPENLVGRASGFGWGIGYLGGLTALCILLFIVFNKNIIHLPEIDAIRLNGPFVALWFLIFSAPLFLFTKDREKIDISLAQSLKKGLTTLYKTFHSVLRYRNTFYFILSRMIYIDGLNTIFAFGGIYAAATFHLDVKKVIEFGIAMNISAGIGAIMMGWIDDWVGSKATILVSLITMIASGVLMVLSNQYIIFWLWGLLLCFFVGPVQSASRSLMLRIAPKQMITEMFGFYALSGKITAFVGPWLMGYITLKFDNQRMGMGSLLIFFLIGGLLLLFVKEKSEESL